MAAAAATPPPAPTRVLIAEDEALIRLDLREMLEEEGFQVVGEAADGAHDLVALLLEGLLQVEPDQGLVLGNDDAYRHLGFREQSLEELVLGLL